MLKGEIEYRDLNSRQQESYNFHKVAALMADYGYSCMKLSDDYNGADFLAMHIGGQILKVQLKGRLTCDEKYRGKVLDVAFPFEGSWYLYPHDHVQDYYLSRDHKPTFSNGHIPKMDMAYFEQFCVQNN